MIKKNAQIKCVSGFRCDAYFNNEFCEYDGGDCCNPGCSMGVGCQEGDGNPDACRCREIFLGGKIDVLPVVLHCSGQEKNWPFKEQLFRDSFQLSGYSFFGRTILVLGTVSSVYHE